MRFQKLLIFSVVIGLSLTLAFEETAMSAPVSLQPSDSAVHAPMLAQASSEADPLLELLRKKQMELDAEQNGAPAKVAAPEPKAPEASKVVPSAKPIAASAANASGETDLLEILRRKQAELDAQGTTERKAQPAPAPVPAVTEKAKPQPKTQPVPRTEEVRPTAPVIQPKAVASQPAVSPEEQDKLLELLRKKQSELDVKEKATVKTPVQPTKPAEVQANKDRIRQIEAEIQAKEEAFKKSAAAPKTSVSTKASKTVSQPRTGPIVAPGSKESRLDELLRKYRADEITPHEYHLERAKIIAEP